MEFSKKYTFLFIIGLIFFNINLLAQYMPAIELTEQYFYKLDNKKVGILCNTNSKIGELHLIDSLVMNGIKVSKIYTPEHGFYVDQPDGKKIFNDKYKTINSKYIQIISLYGDKYKPTPFDLDNVDIILIDLQDVGVRCFTYISTIFYLMDACALKKIPVIILDRANPNGFFCRWSYVRYEICLFCGCSSDTTCIWYDYW